jgi:hypothetical protein
MIASCAQVVVAATACGESVVAGLMAQTRWLAERPVLARFGFLPVLSAGPDGVKMPRMEPDAWSVALQPGFRGQGAPPLLYGEAIAGAIYRLQQHVIVCDGPQALRDLTRSLAFLALEPFLGPAPAATLIRDQLAARDA